MPVIMSRNPNNRRLLILLFLVIACMFIFTRVVYLDRDIPSGKISSYMQIDELYYTIPAFNLYYYGETSHKVVPFIEDKNAPTNIMENAATLTSLRLLGNNYYGLRMPSAVTAFFIFMLLYAILRKILCSNEESLGYNPIANQTMKSQYVLYFLMVYLLVDFSFLLAGRVAEPTIFRMLALTVIIYLGSVSVFSRPLESGYYSALIGFLSMASVLFVYIYNSFIFIALLVTVFMWSYKCSKRNAVKQVVFFLLGSLICLLCYQIYIQVVYNSSLVEVYQTMFPFKYRMGFGGGEANSVETYLTNFFFIFITNIFRFNIIILFVFLVSIPVFVKKVISERNNFDILIFNLIFFLLMQSIIINDYPLRKLIILLPLIIIMVTISYTYFPNYVSKNIGTNISQKSLLVYWIAVWLVTILLASVYINPQVKGAFLVGYVLTFINWVVFLVVSLMMVRNYIFAIRPQSISVIFCLLLMLLPNILLDAKYVFLHRTYYFRDTMIAMSDKVDGKIIAGGLAYGFRLYNNSIPVLNVYITSYSCDENQIEQYHQNFDDVFNSKIAGYSIGLNKEDSIGDASRGYMYKHGLQLDEEYPFYDLIEGNIGLFAPGPK